MVEIHRTLDVTGTLCPLPVIEVRTAMDKMEKGQVLQVIASDPGSRRDIPAWARRTGHELLEVKESGDKFIFLLRKGGD